MRKFWIMLLPAVLLFAIVGCSGDDNEGPENLTSAQQFAAVHDALIDYVNGDAPAIRPTPDETYVGILAAVTDEEFTVLDFRTTELYGEGHIAGAHNVSLGDLLAQLEDRALPLNKPFLCVCKTGQSAGHGVVALRALGYEAYSFKFGMCAWNTALAGPWDDNLVSGVPYTTDTFTPTTTYAWPDWDEDVTNVDDAVYARVDAMLSGGFKGKMYTDIATTLGEYFIINYWGEADYNGTGNAPGHLVDACQFTPKASFAMDEMLEYLPDTGKILVYCWTGQNSSQITAYLNMLGYDAYSLMFGANNMWYDDLTSGTWSDPGNVFPLE